MSKVKLHENKTWTRKSTEYCEYDFPVESEKGEPEFKWQHGKINMEEWHKILSFFKWSYDETKSETQVRLLQPRHKALGCLGVPSGTRHWHDNQGDR